MFSGSEESERENENWDVKRWNETFHNYYVNVYLNQDHKRKENCLFFEEVSMRRFNP